jgi:hypothetical protein
MPQNFANHRHNSPIFIVAAISTVTALVMLGMAALGFGRLHLATTFGLLIVSVICLCLMSRQYATALQDRIIKMEMRYRTDKFLSDDQRKMLWGLTKRQIVALRFASNAEMPALIDRAVKENLSGADIKKAVKDWQADFDRT